MTTTELIPCLRCGRPRPITGTPWEQRRAAERLCMSCSHQQPKTGSSFQPYTLDIPCPQCGRERPRRIFRARELATARKAICMTCNILNNLTKGSTTDIDEMAVQRLLAGQIVNANPAERNAAVAYLTHRKVTARVIAERLHCTKRTVERHRAKLAAA